jgi:hypothetical protein
MVGCDVVGWGVVMWCVREGLLVAVSNGWFVIAE